MTWSFLHIIALPTYYIPGAPVSWGPLHTPCYGPERKSPPKVSLSNVIHASFYLIYLDSCHISFIVIMLKYFVCVFLAQSPWTFNSLEVWIWYLTSTWNLIKAQIVSMFKQLYEVFSLIWNIFRLPVATPSASPPPFYAGLCNIFDLQTMTKMLPI